MSKGIVGVIVAVLLVGAGAWWWQSRQMMKEEQNPVKKEVIIKKDDVTMSKTEDAIVPKDEKTVNSQGEIEKNEIAKNQEGKIMLGDPKDAMAKPEGEMMKKGGYMEYGANTLEQTKELRRVFFFYANWCPYCKAADVDFQQNVTMIPNDVVLIRVNYSDSDTDDVEKGLAGQYGITYQHSFVQIDQDGKVITSWNGGGTKELLQNIK